jgi:hypothetical protein
MNAITIVSFDEIKKAIKRIGSSAAKHHPVDHMRGYHISLDESGKLQMFCTDGFRIAYYSTKASLPDSEGTSWIAAVSKPIFEAAVQSSCFAKAILTLSEDGKDLQFKESLGDRYFSVPTVENRFKINVVDTVIRNKKILKSVDMPVQTLRPMIDKQMKVPACTYKGIDNDEVFFVYVSDSTASFSKTYELNVPNSESTTIGKQFISDFLKSIHCYEQLTVQLMQLRRPDSLPMLVIEDSFGGIGIMPLAAVRTRFLNKIQVNESFRVPGFAATFTKRQFWSTLEEGDVSGLEKYEIKKLNCGAYEFPESMEVFYETYDESKLRIKRQRLKAKR